MGGLIYFTRTPIKKFVHSRFEQIRTELHTVQEQLRTAQEQYRTYSSKTENLTSEIHEMKEQFKVDLQSTRVKIQSEAKRQADQIRLDARLAAEGSLSDLRERLKRETAEKVIERAESLLREKVTQADRSRFRSNFETSLGTVSGSRRQA
jgi:F-type H+-transporting ATPase subunit b